jgi:hypothetical protein
MEARIARPRACGGCQIRLLDCGISVASAARLMAEMGHEQIPSGLVRYFLEKRTLPRRLECHLGLVEAIGHAAVRAVRRSPLDLGAVRAPRESDKGSGAPQARRFESR